MPTTAQEFMSPEDLAELFGVPVASIYGWRYKGAGPKAFKIGRHLRYRRSDVEKWLEEQSAPRRTA